MPSVEMLISLAYERERSGCWIISAHGFGGSIFVFPFETV